MRGLPDLLTEVADEAKAYDGIDRAVRVLRRRRRMTRLIPAVVATVVVAGLMLTYVSVKPGPGGDPAGGLDIPSGSVSWLPQTLTVGQSSSPPLPNDRGVGLASLIYQRRTPLLGDDQTALYLVSVDGGQYRLPSSPLYSLSPDGRWLLSVWSNNLVLRDLTGTGVSDLGEYLHGAFAAAWSSDTSRLVFEQSADSAPSLGSLAEGAKELTYERATVVDLPSVERYTVALTQFPGTRVCGVRDSGDLILCASVARVDEASAWVADGRTGEQRSHILVNLRTVLTGSERPNEAVRMLLAVDVRPLAGGATLLVRTGPTASLPGDNTVGDLLVVDVTNGNLVRRLDLPGQVAGSPVPTNDGATYTPMHQWTVLSALDDGILLAHVGPRGTGAVLTVLGLELLDPVSGQRLAVTTVFGDVASVILRGGSTRGI